MKRKSVASDGTCCPRCGQIASLKELVEPSAKQLENLYYYKRIYRCNETTCRTEIFFKDSDRVFKSDELIIGENSLFD